MNKHFSSPLNRIGALCLIMLVLSLLLYRQIKQKQVANKAAEARMEALQARDKPEPPNYDNAEERAKTPLDVPDWLDEPGFRVDLDEKRDRELALEVAQGSRKRASQRKMTQAGSSLNDSISLPPPPYVNTYEEFIKRYQKFRLRELEAYQKLTTDPVEIKESGEQFLRAYIISSTDEESSYSQQDVRNLAAKVFESGTEDPLLRTYAAKALYIDEGDPENAEKIWAETVQQLRNSSYPRIVQVYLRSFAYEAIQNHMGSTDRMQALAVCIVKWLEEVREEDVELECAAHKLKGLLQLFGSTLESRVLSGCLNSGQVDPFIVHWLLGREQVNLGWSARGGEFAYKTSRSQFQKFKKHLIDAQSHLEHAYLLRPDIPFPAQEMIRVSLGGYDTEYKPEDWFRRVIEIQFDCPDTYLRIGPALQPRWGGSLREFQSYMQSCLETDRFDTFVPYVGIDLIYHLHFQEFDSDWKKVKAYGFDKFLDDFLRARARYRAWHPGEKLYGDSPDCNTRLAQLFEHFDRPNDALAEYRRAGDQLNFESLQNNNRPGRHLLKLFLAAQGKQRSVVLDFDRKLRQRWSADTNLSEIEDLQQEWMELQAAAVDEYAQPYFDHTKVMLSQLSDYLKGNWVELSFDRNRHGWELRADKIEWSDNGDSIILCRINGGTQQISAWPLVHYDPPFEIQAEMGHGDYRPHLTLAGVHWENPNRDTDSTAKGTQKKNSPDDVFVGLKPERWLRTHLMDGTQVDTPFWKYLEYAVVTAPDLSGTFQDGMHVPQPGLRKLDWKFWPDRFEVLLGNHTGVVRLTKSIAPLGSLSFGEHRGYAKAINVKTHNGKWELSNVRIRRLSLQPAPPVTTSSEEQLSFWTNRTEQATDDVLAKLKVCEFLLKQERAQEAYDQLEKIAVDHPDLHQLIKLQGLALHALHRYEEAITLLDRAEYCLADDFDVYVAQAEIKAAAPIEELRDGKNAVGKASIAYSTTSEQKVRVWAVTAAGYAEMGDFEQAFSNNQQAIDLADEPFKSKLLIRHELYKNNQPFRLPALDGPSPE